MVRERLARAIGVVLTVVLVALLVGGVWLYRDQERQGRRRVESQLTAVAELKTREISAWRAERLDEGVELADRVLLASLLRAWLESPQDGELDSIRSELGSVRRHKHYADVLVLDPVGRVRLSLAGATSADGETSLALAQAFGDGRPVLTDLHRRESDSSVHLSVVVPLFDGETGRAQPVGAVVLVSDASTFLYPLIQTWPTPSDTAETLLIRADGDGVLFLNELRHRAGAALTLRVSTDQEDLPAVMAVRGTEGIVQGVDYRGADVIAAVRAIPDSPWYMVAKMDTKEAFAEWQLRSGLMVALLLGVALLGGALFLVGRQRDQKVHFQSLYRLEAERAAGEVRFGVTLASIGDGVITTDAEGRVELLNPVAEQLTGWAGEDARGRPQREVFNIINEETRAEVESPAARVLREGVVVGLANHTLLVARDGTERPIADSGAPIRDEEGNILGVVLVFRDQTEERAAQREARLLTDTIRSSLDEMYLFDAESLRFRFANDGALHNLGYSTEEIERLTPLDLKPDFTVESLATLLRPLRERQRAVQAFETLHRRKDGTTYPVEVHLQLFDHLGDEVFLATIRDITQRKAAEEQLLQSEHDLKRAQQVARVGSWKWHIPANRLEWSDEMYAIFGVEKEGFSGDLADVVARAIHPDDRAAVEQSNRAVAEEGSPVPIEYRVVLPDGSERIVYAEAGELRRDADGNPALLTGVVQDITERKKQEKEWENLQSQLMQAQKMDSVGRLAGGVAHDFNNMLSVILGHTELALEDADLSPQSRSDLEAVWKAANVSRDLTRQLLAFARRQTVAPAVVDLNEAVPALLKMLQRLIGEDIDLVWSPGRGLRPVEIDPSQIDQILANLCVNAREAIDGVGKVTIETANMEFDEAYCALHAGFLPGEYVMLAVSDDGHGFGRDVMDQLFEPFFTTDTTGRNTGLGLATVYGIVKQNEGFINVYSEPGEGSTFRIYLPRSESDVQPPDIGVASSEGAAPGETVLVVEDEAAILSVVTRMLENLGYEVLPAATAKEAIRIAEERPQGIDLLLTDVVMPEMNGRALADCLRQITPEMKCLFVSGYTADVIAHRGVLDEGVHFLEKPFSRQALADKVREVLED